MGTDRQYYSGSQTSLFIGNIWVDDIDQLSYSVKSSKVPIYGYGSTHFDFVTKGSTLVQGTFSINFREPNYLWAVLKNYEKFNKRLTLQDRKTDKFTPLTRDQSEYLKIYETFENDPRSNFDYFFNASTGKASQAAKTLKDKHRTILDLQDTNGAEKFHHNSFNILLGYGHELNSESPGEVISGVQLLERTKTIVTDGRPIKEIYSFIARRID